MGSSRPAVTPSKCNHSGATASTGSQPAIRFVITHISRTGVHTSEHVTLTQVFKRGWKISPSPHYEIKNQTMSPAKSIHDVSIEVLKVASYVIYW